MIGIEQYQKIQEYKELGLAQTKTAKALGITYTSVSKYWNMSKEDYAREVEQESKRLIEQDVKLKYIPFRPAKPFIKCIRYFSSKFLVR